jgi:hypothetical protein
MLNLTVMTALFLKIFAQIAPNVLMPALLKPSLKPIVLMLAVAWLIPILNFLV